LSGGREKKTFRLGADLGGGTFKQEREYKADFKDRGIG
jgi:hypothetical protein